MEGQAKDSTKKKVEPEVELVLCACEDELVKRFKAEYKKRGNKDLLYQVPYLSELAHQYQHKDGWPSLLRAHALYNSCSVRDPENKEKWLERAYQVQLKYWRKDLQTFPEHLQVTQSLKCELEEIRARGKQQSERITHHFQSLNCEPEKLSCPANQELYVHILQDVARLSHSVNQDMINFTKSVVEKSVGICGSPLVDYCVVALGSMARGEMTPYSDLEFLFLVESKSDEILQYFERLAVTIYFLTGNLCETKLKVMAIPELISWDVRKKRLFHWFDDTCMSGFKIDGLGSWAGNIPTGGTPKQSNQFICTVKELAERYKFVLDKPHPDESLKGDLTAMLANTVYITGDKHLHDNFKSLAAMHQPSKKRRAVTLKMLAADVDKFDFKPNYDLTHIRQLKPDIYRYPSILILNLKILHQIQSSDPWEVIHLLKLQNKVSSGTAECLKYAFCCALFIRLSAYFYHNSQSDSISVLSCKSDDNLYTGAWYVRPGLLMHMFVHLGPLKLAVSETVKSVDGHISRIDVEMNDTSKHETAALVRYYCGDFHEVLSLLRVVHADRLKAMDVDSFLIRMYIQSAILCSEYVEAEELTMKRIQSLKYNEGDFWLLGRLYQEQSHYSLSLDAYEVRLAILISLHGFHDHSDIAQAFCNIGIVLYNQSQFSEAVVELTKCLKMRQRLYGEGDHIGIADVLSNIGLVLADQSKYSEALVEYKKCLDMYVRIFGYRDHIKIANMLSSIGLVLVNQSQYSEALVELNKSLDMYKRIYLGRDHAGIANLMSNIGVVLERQSKHSEALDVYSECLAMYKRIHGDKDHVNTARIICNIGVVLRIQSKLAEALAEFKKGFDMYKRLYGDSDHIHIANVLGNIGNVLRDQKDYEMALEKYQKCMDILLKIHKGINHKQIASVLCNIGVVLCNLNRHEEAMQKYEKCLDIFQTIYRGRDHADVAQCYCNIGALLCKQLEYARALLEYRRSLDMYLRVYGNRDHVKIAEIIFNIAGVLVSQGGYIEALDEYRKSLDMSIRIFGDVSHPFIAILRKNIQQLENLIGGSRCHS